MIHAESPKLLVLNIEGFVRLWAQLTRLDSRMLMMLRCRRQGFKSLRWSNGPETLFLFENCQPQCQAPKLVDSLQVKICSIQRWTVVPGFCSHHLPIQLLGNSCFPRLHHTEPIVINCQFGQPPQFRHVKQNAFSCIVIVWLWLWLKTWRYMKLIQYQYSIRGSCGEITV